MAYFANGTSGDRYMEQWCFRCVNWRETDNCGCIVWDFHIIFDYRQCGNEIKLMSNYKPLEGILMNDIWLFVDLDRCMGCQSCEVACQAEHNIHGIEVITIGAKKGTYMPVFTDDCHKCKNRTIKGLKPVCISACPFNARYVLNEQELQSKIDNKIQIYAIKS